MHARREAETDGANTAPRARTERPGQQADRIRALQRTAGNAAVVQTMPDTILGRGSGGRGPAGLVANSGAAERERELSERFGVRIGPPPSRPNDHFSHSMLHRIETVLSSLPEADIRDNEELRVIEPAAADSDSAASTYDGETRTITMVSPFGMPSWLYTELNRGVPWQRKLMDQGAMADYDGISETEDEALGIDGREREVMGGFGNVLANGNLVKWTLRHEIGHSVDKRTQWLNELKHLPHFGGWETYGKAENQNIEPIVNAVLLRAGLGDHLTIRDRYHVTLPQAVALELNSERAWPDPALLRNLAANFPGQDETFHDRLAKVVEFGRLALAQPWTLPDGGGDVLTVDGRTYHVDHYGNWVSYLREQRQLHAVSNYMFSTPDEWFAEAYAAFHDPKQGARDRLHPDARAWFEEAAA
ncbi:hypothetical protein [Streptomyces sp. NPDC094049]|uniref:hypothetical protein n=1 Tax=Streptomyces sp. NPDC094049 TaxID=3154987 RepID=UPI003331CEE3